MTENNNEHIINIDIEKIFNDKNISAEKLIHQQTRKKLDSLIEDVVRKANTLKDNNKSENTILNQLNTIRSTNTIFIHGKRGAGKTTFIKSVLVDYLENKNNDNQTKVSPVAFIYPTLVGTGQYLLIDIIVRTCS